MCQECGCGRPGPYNIDGRPAREVASPLSGLPASTAASPVTHHHHPHDHPHHDRDHGHDHHHDHPHDHDHPHSNAYPHEEHAILEVNQPVLAQNDRFAERNRGYFKATGVLALNILSSPGAGKTTLIEKTIEALKSRQRCGVIVGDLATDNDAQRLRATGAPIVQITTGTLCHLEAEMVARALGRLDARALDLLIIENVGNLVCPAAFDLGEELRVVLLSVTEGEDKPLKYPPMFRSAHVVIVTKADLSLAAGFDREAALANVRRASPRAHIFELSARSGQGLEEWIRFLASCQERLSRS